MENYIDCSRIKNGETVNLDSEILKQSKCDPEISQSDIDSKIEQVFLCCETGNKVFEIITSPSKINTKGAHSKLESILESYPYLKNHLNEQKSCYVVNNQIDLTPLQLSAACGYTSVIQVLLACDNVDVNFADPVNGMNALHFAVLLGQLYSVELLLAVPKINSQAKTVEGKNVYHLAVENEDVRIIELLLTSSRPVADLTIPDNLEGNTVFHYAAIYPNEKVFRLLIKFAELNDYFTTRLTHDWMLDSENTSIFEIKNKSGETARSILLSYQLPVNRLVYDDHLRLRSPHTNQSIIEFTTDGSLFDDEYQFTKPFESDLNTNISQESVANHVKQNDLSPPRPLKLTISQEVIRRRNHLSQISLKCLHLLDKAINLCNTTTNSQTSSMSSIFNESLYSIGPHSEHTNQLNDNSNSIINCDSPTLSSESINSSVYSLNGDLFENRKSNMNTSESSFYQRPLPSEPRNSLKRNQLTTNSLNDSYVQKSPQNYISNRKPVHFSFPSRQIRTRDEGNVSSLPSQHDFNLTALSWSPLNENLMHGKKLSSSLLEDD